MTPKIKLKLIVQMLLCLKLPLSVTNALKRQLMFQGWQKKALYHHFKFLQCISTVYSELIYFCDDIIFKHHKK